MSATKQELLSLKEDNLKLKENFKKFLKKHESNKKYISKDKVKEFVEAQDTLIDNLNQRIDDIMVKDENGHLKTAGVLPKKRKNSEILSVRNKNITSKRSHIEHEIVQNSLENVINNPGFQHLAENIFLYLNYKDLKACQCINRSSKSILANPRFWLKKFIQKGMSKKNQMDWLKAIQLIQNEDLKRNVYLYLKRSLRIGKMVDIPCYIDSSNIKKYSRSYKFVNTLYNKYDGGNIEVIQGAIQILAADCKVERRGYFRRGDWSWFMCKAAERGNFEIIKSLSPLMENPNASRSRTKLFTPIINASRKGHLEIVKFLVSLLGTILK